VASSATTVPGGRSALERSPASRVPDQVLKWGLTGLALAILALIVFFFIRLIGESGDTFSKFGLSFIFGNDWDTSKDIYHGFPLVFGTIVTSAMALIIGVPIAVATAIYTTELCPRRFRPALSLLVDLLAAVPSVVYGLWGVFVLIPRLKPFMNTVFGNWLSFIPFIGGGAPTPGSSYFIAGLILAIMILPIVSAISREVIATVPSEQKEAALALGATRWEMIKIAVLPYSRPGITGGAMLGLGRAVGETIAVVLVIGNAATIGHHLISQGYSLAAVIANEFGEAANNPVHSSALFAAGLVLFVLTLIINAFARWFVARGERKMRGGGGGGAAETAVDTQLAPPGVSAAGADA
jgi:phosphate ABC transporter permease protein PstC